MDYSELSQAIQDYCQNSETTFVSHINDFIIAAEDKVFMSIQMPAFWSSDIAEVTADGTAEYALEEGVIDVLSVRIGETAASAEDVEKGPVRYLLRKDYDFLLEAYSGTSSAAYKALPVYYAVSSASVVTSNPTVTIRMGPIPDAIYPLTIDYYGKTAAQSITSGSTPAVPLTTKTWLSVTMPDVLLYGSLVQAYTFMKGEPDIVQLYQNNFMEGLALLKNLGEGRQTSDVYSEGQMKVESG
ncbi:hypothetical protein CMI37_28235 [Candidatus Pacearchaeota archaeon]|nr:hypothetical protein [Candidatus Pacearchaeota archaeon]|tara:strand:+ start:3651 stop:4376 length:726 start_codon:yes stop_codon:yes gene_type:complete